MNTSTEIFKNEMESIPDTRLAEMAHSAISKLCAHGDRSFVMTVPPRTDDTDMVLSEIFGLVKNLR